MLAELTNGFPHVAAVLAVIGIIRVLLLNFSGCPRAVPDGDAPRGGGGRPVLEKSGRRSSVGGIADGRCRRLRRFKSKGTTFRRF